jgi:hypothetical protein
MLVSNIRENGKAHRLAARRRDALPFRFLLSGETGQGHVLYAIEVPSQGVTLVPRHVQGLRDAPPAAQARVEGRKAVNAYLWESPTREINGAKLDLSIAPHFAQPIVRTIPTPGARHSTSTG